MEFINNYAVDVYSLSGNFVGNWPSIREATKALGIRFSSNISSCIHGKRNKAAGYVWKRSSIPVDIPNDEEWRPVVGFENLYAVSNKGRVASLQFHGKPSFSLMSILNCRGYPGVKLRNSKTGFAGVLKIHRLVAEAFIPNPDNKPCVDHVDTNPKNNLVENLRWVTNLENQRNPLTLSRISTHMQKLNANKVGPTISAKNRSIKVKHVLNGVETFYDSAQKAGIETGHTTSIILRWCRANRYGWSLA